MPTFEVFERSRFLQQETGKQDFVEDDDFLFDTTLDVEQGSGDLRDLRGKTTATSKKYQREFDHEKVLSWKDSDPMDDQIAVEAAVRSATGSALRSSTSTPPIDIAGHRSFRRNFALVTDDDFVAPTTAATRVNATDARARVSELSSRAEKRRRRKANKQKAAKAEPALNVVRGFTPAASVDGDSELSTPETSRIQSPRIQALKSTVTSPGLRPSLSCGGISALRLQLETLNLDVAQAKVSGLRSQDAGGIETPSSMSMGSDTESGVMSSGETTCYEVPLKNDFVSTDAAEDTRSEVFEGSSTAANILSRKMTAADFEPITCLGKGSYGTVLLVKQVKSGRLFAQKQFKKASLTVHKKLIEQTRTERAILESVNRHPFVVKLYYAFQDLEKLYLILEYAQGGELFTHLAMEKIFSESTASFYMAEMALALDHLHRTVGVIYRDLKPENCLLDAEGHLLLTDFGLSKVSLSDDDRCNSTLGTIEYMAPEVVRGLCYGKACDWWSLGALGYDLLSGSPPFTANNHTRTMEKIVHQKLKLPYFLSPDAKDLLTRLLRKDPGKRLGGNMPKDMQTIKGHRFFRKIDWKLLEKREMEPPIRPLVTNPELAENFSKEFTELCLSPVVEGKVRMGEEEEEENPFGGFSFVAPASFLESQFQA